MPSCLRPFPSIGNRAAFTLIELLVVIAIIVLLVGVTVTVGLRTLDSSKSSGTRSMLRTVQMAIDQFHEERPLHLVSRRFLSGGVAPDLTGYSDLFGNYPPDMLDIFQKPGVIGGLNLPDVRSNDDADLSEPSAASGLGALKNDTKAMMLAIRLYSSEASAILDSLPSRYLSYDDHYYDRDGMGTSPGPADIPLAYLVDDWGTPVSFFSARDLTGPARPQAWPALGGYSLDHYDASWKLQRASGNVPVLVSYGPNGREQLTAGPQGQPVTLIEDLADPDRDGTAGDGTAANVVDNTLNQDNIYPDAYFGDRIWNQDLMPQP